MPLPAPATAHLLEGFKLSPTTLQRELVTPTGAALLRGCGAKIHERLPEGTLSAIGWGAGTISLPDRPNLLRALLFQSSASEAKRGETRREERRPAARCWQLETNIDDSSPEQLAYLSAALLERGALDVWQTPITMKKGRLAVTLAVLCELSQRPALEALILRDSSALGLRATLVDRSVLERELIVVETPLGPARVKRAKLDGAEGYKMSPEFEDASALAKRSGRAIGEVFRIILEAAQTRGT
jgi:hypothetical protein